MRDETAEPSAGSPPIPGMPRSRPHLWQSGVCTRSHTQVAARACWPEFGLSSFALVCASFSLLRSLVLLAIGIPIAERFSARALFLTFAHHPRPPPQPRIIVNTTRSDQTPPPKKKKSPREPSSCLARLASTPVKF